MLSIYEILAPLGAGAMGEVYRAMDTRLHREVAIKVLPEHFASDDERLRRFEREARSLAALNHPNVAQIFAVDRVGDVGFLVLELVPGESLQDRLARGPLPIAEALDVCRQIADGLDAAHEAGVIHRDLKPANVRLTPEGKVKVLDFGLAKPARETSDTAKTDSVLSTEVGRVLGTPTYMAPEQARGRAIDRRVDIWAFGCVLYECLAGRRAFAGETLTEVLAAVLEREPDLTKLPAATPPHVRELLADCLAKDPRERARDIGELRRQLARTDRSAPSGKRSSQPGAAVGLALVAAVAGAIAGGLAMRGGHEQATADEPTTTRFLVTFPAAGQRSKGKLNDLALTADGRTLAVSLDGEHTGIYLRELDATEPHRLTGPEGPDYLCFAPDGRSLAYFDRRRDALLRIGLDGGVPRVLAPQIDATGLDWSPKHGIACVPEWDNGLVTVQPADSAKSALTHPHRSGNDRAHLNPSFLPDSSAVLYHVWTGGEWSDARIDVLELASGEYHTVLTGATSPSFLPLSAHEGALLYARADSLWARRFDPQRLTCSDDEVLVAEGVQTSITSGTARYAVSASGTLAYQPKIPGLGNNRLVWVDREGREERATPEDTEHQSTSLSADGKRVLFARAGAVFSLFAVDLDAPLAQRLARRLTFESDSSEACLSPDGRSMVFTSNPNGPYEVFRQDIAGNATPRRIAGEGYIPNACSPDGRWLACTRGGTNSRTEIWILSMDGTAEPRPMVQLPGNSYDARFSPDGAWLSYVTDASTEGQIQVVSFPGAERRLQVTSEKGFSPRWSHDGSELFFRREDQYYAIPIKRDPELSFGTPKLLFSGTYSREWRTVCFQQAPDGRFLMTKPDLPPDLELRVVVVQNLAAELRAKFAARTPR